MRGARSWTSLLLVAVAGTVLGCGGADIVCTGGGGPPAIQVRVVDGLTGAVVPDAMVTARYFIGGEGDATIFPHRNSRGEMVPTVWGAYGLYEVTVRKTAYANVVQRVTVPSTGGQCAEAITVDLTISLFPVR